MKILVVPDVHGRDFWIEPCHNWQGSIVFLGDYHDPYPFQVSKEKSLKNLKELVEFVTNNKDRCTCLMGNHDRPYLICETSGCRFDFFHSKTVRKLIEELNLQLCLLKDDVIFSHAGITPDWCNNTGYDPEDIARGEMSRTNGCLEEISWYRGGDNPYGSMLWCDVNEYAKLPHYSGYYQIFGHSQQESDPVIKEDYACLDCRRCFIVDTETKEIKEW